MSDHNGARMKTRCLRAALLFTIIGGGVGCAPLGAAATQDRKPRCTSDVGKVQVTLLETGSEKSKDRFTIFMVDPAGGVVSQGAGESVGGRSPEGAFFGECDETTKVSSPDRTKIATCKEESQEKGSVSVLLVLDSKTKSLLARVPLPPKSALGGAAWSPDSKAIAYLIKQQALGRKPLDLLSAAAGHPVPYNSYNLEILCVATADVRKIPNVIKKNPYGLAWVEWLPSSGRGSRVARPSLPRR